LFAAAAALLASKISDAYLKISQPVSSNSSRISSLLLTTVQFRIETRVGDALCALRMLFPHLCYRKSRTMGHKEKSVARHPLECSFSILTSAFVASIAGSSSSSSSATSKCRAVFPLESYSSFPWSLQVFL